MVEETLDWDEPLSEAQREETPLAEDDLSTKVHIFADASEKAIAAVAYLQTVDATGSTHISFLMGKTKVAPKHGHSIPRLELCTALMAVEIGECLFHELSLEPGSMTFYSDSKVVSGYLKNTTRRFYVYVSNRVERILRFSKREQWLYVESQQNPADQGTRGVPTSTLKASLWIHGPGQLQQNQSNDLVEETFPLVEPLEDNEIRPDVHVMKTEVSSKPLSDLFEKFSSWTKLTKVVYCVMRAAKRFKDGIGTKSENNVDLSPFEWKRRAEEFIIKEVQDGSYGREVSNLLNKEAIPKNSSIEALAPTIDDDGILRVGGRLRKSNLSALEKNPILIPGKQHVATLLTRHFHASVNTRVDTSRKARFEQTVFGSQEVNASFL
ncbi:uncharacterized protein LOC117330168 [Pecten maximus]|uniref:uncharacterized protein LOC117330168 n=1 Tax=Pecten maximus TaxID=6579 RepID=UPI001458FEDB|nr:uncharacterized protein LOC117330168 [Pecten maximus]